jgi:hypothetical protein
MSALRDRVKRRARGRCEYCLLPEKYSTDVPFQLEHIVAVQHRGPTVLPNLAFACHRCNLFKGPNLTSIDPETGRLVKLYNPRRMKWSRHFAWDGPLLIGQTSVGRATVALLRMNHGDRVELRITLIEEGRFP